MYSSNTVRHDRGEGQSETESGEEQQDRALFEASHDWPRDEGCDDDRHNLGTALMALYDLDRSLVIGSGMLVLAGVAALVLQ